MNDNHDYYHIIKLATKMHEKAKTLYKKTKTNEDLKFIILAKLFLGDAYSSTKQTFKAYYFYCKVAKGLEKVYLEIKEVSIKNDLIDVYQKLDMLTNHKMLRLINKKWKLKILQLKES